MNDVKALFVIINIINGYIRESNGNKYLTPITTDEGRNTLEQSEKLWNKIKDFIRSIRNRLHNSKLKNSGNLVEK